jgi:hypothetical protein
MSGPRIEEVTDDQIPKTVERTDESDDSDAEEGNVTIGSTTVIQNRNEKKARKSILKLGLVRVPGITRVTFKRSKNVRAEHLDRIVCLRRKSSTSLFYLLAKADARRTSSSSISQKSTNLQATTHMCKQVVIDHKRC